jgi:peptide deformylase
MTVDDFLANPPTEIVKFPSEILTSPTEPVIYSEKIVKVCEEMFKLMYQFEGVGLAAPQVNLPYRIFVVNPLCDPSRKDKELAFINPEAFQYGKRTSTMIEGCLSLPGTTVEITRPHKVIFQAINLQGEKHKYCYEGMLARIIQHETDHLFQKLIIFIE